MESFHRTQSEDRTKATRRKPIPSYLKHKQSGRARVIWYDSTGVRHQKLLPGPFNSQGSKQAFALFQTELLSNPTIVPKDGISVEEMLVAYLDFAMRYYRKADGEPTSEVNEIKHSIRPVRELYGSIAAKDFGPKNLAAVRQHMIGIGWCRTLINKRIDRLKRAIKWSVAEELIPVSVYEAVRTLSGLRRGRTEARESKPVKPVSDQIVRDTLPRLPHYVRVMVELMMHTGMRPSEVCAMTLNAIDRSGDVWTYRPKHHKTAHHNKERSIPLGPMAQDVLFEFLRGRVIDHNAPIFSPAAAREERFQAMRDNRKSKVQPSQQSRRKSKPQLQPAERYHPHAIAHAIRVACEKLKPLPKALASRKGESKKHWWERLTERQRADVKAWRELYHWHPYQLRHTFGTLVRKNHGLEAAGAALGHTKMSATEIYAERDAQLAATVALKMG